jgi:hypothetical protein
MRHRQPDPDEGHERFVTEPIWTQLLPLTTTSQYMLFWYAAETLPHDVEQTYESDVSSSGDEASRRIYRPPPSFPPDTTLEQRIAQDAIEKDGEATTYEPVWHAGTGVDEEERLYKSHLLPIDEAMKKLKGSVMADVIRRGWEGIQLRLEIEAGERDA